MAFNNQTGQPWQPGQPNPGQPGQPNPGQPQKLGKNDPRRLAKTSSTARYNLLLVVILSVVNLLIYFATDGEGLFFFFSTWFSYWKAIWYDLTGETVALVLAILMLAAMLACYLFWNRNKIFPILGTLVFAIDCAYLVYWINEFPASMDLMGGDMAACLIYHLAALVYMILGVRAAWKLEKAQTPCGENPQYWQQPRDGKGPEF